MTPARGAAAVAEMASEPPPGSTGGAPRTPPPPSAPHVSYTRRCVVLVDWWLERVVGEEGKIRVAGYVDTPQMRKGESSSKENMKVAGRVFRSAVIAKRLDYNVIETEDGYRIRICSFLNITKTCENGFAKKVYEFFETGFPFQWHELVHPNIEQENEHAQSTSESTANAPRHSVEYYMDKYTSDSFPNVLRYAFTENDFFSSVGHTSDIDGIDGGRTDMPEKLLTPPGETCTGGQESEHGSMQIHTSEQEIVNRPISSASVMQSTNSKVDDSILAPTKIVSVEKEGYRSRVCRIQPEEDADIQHKNMQSSSSEQAMVTLPVDSAIVNENLNNLNSTSSDLGEPATLKCGKASVNLGTRDALELPSERMTPQSEAVPSEDSTVRRLRSGKVFGTPNGGTMKRGRKQQKIQHEASSKNMEPKEGAIFTADLTSHKNGLSAAGIVAEDKQEVHDSHSKRHERLAKKAKKRKSESTKLFWNWL